MSKKKQAMVGPNGSELTPREERVVKYMKVHKSISAQEAETALHDHRLATAIESLRHKRGYNINTLRVEITNAYGENTWYGRYVFALEDKKGKK